MTDINSPLTIKSLKLKNRLILAPVDGIFQTPYRKIAVEHGIGMTFSEMIPVRAIKHNTAELMEKMRPDETEKPYIMQLADHEPALIAEIAKYVEKEQLADGIDINMGCPSKLVTGSGNGSALMKTPEIAREIVREVRQTVSLPLSVKIRAGWDKNTINAVEIAQIAYEEGADWITVHPRTRTQAFGGLSDWSIIKAVKEALPIPVVGNGDVKSSADAKRMLDETGCDAVMIARAAFGNPWLIDKILNDNDDLEPTPKERAAMILRHIDMHCEKDGDIRGVLKMRKHIAWYIKSLPHASKSRSLVMTMPDKDEVKKIISDYFASVE